SRSLARPTRWQHFWGSEPHKMTDLAAVQPLVSTDYPGTPGVPPARPDFQIVPRKGLPIVGAVFAALVAAIVANKLWPLVFLHVAFGAAWTNVDLFMGFVIGPTMGKLPPPARIEVAT